MNRSITSFARDFIKKVGIKVRFSTSHLSHKPRFCCAHLPASFSTRISSSVKRLALVLAAAALGVARCVVFTVARGPVWPASLFSSLVVQLWLLLIDRLSSRSELPGGMFGLVPVKISRQ